ncbi:hypothetical protein FDUTEX481_00416 [Tolypothrix sp. PCC 7601]|nr:hypothetical protein FDUTEX481_00416 [Tolypothrix sp. PCC 7601]
MNDEYKLLISAPTCLQRWLSLIFASQFTSQRQPLQVTGSS